MAFTADRIGPNSFFHALEKPTLLQAVEEIQNLCLLLSEDSTVRNMGAELNRWRERLSSISKIFYDNKNEHLIDPFLCGEFTGLLEEVG